MSRLTSVFADLRDAFNTGGIESLYRAHLSARSTCFSYRCLYGLANLMLPVNPLFEIVKDLDQQVLRHGVAAGSAVVLDRPPVPWERVLPEDDIAEISTGRVIVYGKHGSVLTPLLVAAALGRSDLKMIGASYIASLGPHIGACTYAVHPSTPIPMRTAGRKGVIPRILGWIACKLDPPLERAEAKERNRAALTEATDHVRQGGALLIAPDPREPGDAWRAGIGVMISSLAQDHPEPCDCLLVPYRIWDASITGIFHLLSRNPLLRALGRRRFRHPARIVFEQPLSLRDVVAQTGLDPHAITAYLETGYHKLGF